MKTRTIVIDVNIILIAFVMIFLYFAFKHHYSIFEQYLMVLKVLIIVPVVNYYVSLKEKNHQTNRIF